MRLLRANDVAEILACSRSQVYALKDEGRLPFCKLGGLVRFRQEDVEQFIADSMVRSATQRAQHPRSPRLKHLHL
jgi:excisionase family DNA binding protein